MTPDATGDRIPVIPRGVRRHHDGVRGQEVLLGPERALMLDQTAVAILAAVDGARSLADIAGHLSATYNAPRDVIEPDVIAFLDGLADQMLITYA
ncbi:MAG: pyrroloquinoline quinone biosynthesis peptide chaperone PqqD [Rhodobacteraceae bacterium]|nr:pyrroloquinoline quinone biosynthesis peptide chaperone PqqD [Paracoccaceae bacterium]